MDRDDPVGDDEPSSRLLPPDDRLWRHPSEIGAGAGGPTTDRRRVPSARLLVVALAAGVIGALVAVGLLAATGNLRRVLRVPVVERVALDGVPTASAGARSPEVVEITERLRPAVVGLDIEIDGVERRIRGAGVMFRSDGHVLTNGHVVEGAARVVVVTADGRRASARVVGTDPWSDLAVVKVDEDLTFPVATMGSAATLAIGQTVMAIGGPVGRDEPAVEVGLVEGLGRQVRRLSGADLLDMIHTTAPVAATSSGGALVDGRGAVVGIITAATPDGGVRTTRAGYATPIDWARTVADQLLATGRVTRVWMGVEGSDLDAETAQTMGVGSGALVNQVRADSPADDAGLQADDVVTSVDAVPVASMAALRAALRNHQPGEVVTVTVRRGTDTRSLKVHLAERPAQT